MKNNKLISSGIDEFLKYLRETESLNRISIDSEQEMNDAMQDILHSLELEKHDYHEKAQLANKIIDIRKERRDAKNSIIQTAPVVEWIHNNRRVINELEQLLGKVRKEEKNSQGRIYTPKTNVTSDNACKHTKRKQVDKQ